MNGVKLTSLNVGKLRFVRDSNQLTSRTILKIPSLALRNQSEIKNNFKAIRTKRHQKSLRQKFSKQALFEVTQQKWLCKRKKGVICNFSNEELLYMRNIFRKLDVDGSGSISIEQLYDPLHTMGLIESKEAVEELIKKVDTNKNGSIQFIEFVKVFKLIREELSNFQWIRRFFKQIFSNKQSYKLFINKTRRNFLMETVRSQSSAKIEAVLKRTLSLGRQMICRDSPLSSVGKMSPCEADQIF